MKSDLILSVPARPTPYAVLGQPINHSLSPLMQQAAFDHCGFSGRYYRIEVGEEGMARAVRDLRAVPFGGWNCTVPDKVKMFELCDRVTDSARRPGVVNAVVNEGGTLVGHNTDGIGWSRALREAFGEGPGAYRILLLGAGGAGRAIAMQAMLENCPDLIIANRTASRARELIDHLRTEFAGAAIPPNVRQIKWSEVADTVHEVDLVVNATSAGLDPTAPVLLQAHVIPPHLHVYDTIYGVGCEKLRREVEISGARWADGLGMLLHQGAAGFSLWTGEEAPLEVMRQALDDAFSASRR